MYVEIESYVFIQGKIINNYEKIVGKIFSKTTRAEKNQTYVRASSGSVVSSFFKPPEVGLQMGIEF